MFVSSGRFRLIIPDTRIKGTRDHLSAKQRNGPMVVIHWPFSEIHPFWRNLRTAGFLFEVRGDME